MQPSYYLKAFPCEERPSHILLYLISKAAAVLVKEDTFRAMKNGGLSSKDEAALFKLGMIVPDQQEEKQAVATLFDDFNAESTRLDVVIVLNFDCNFDCTYCFEKGQKGKFYMSDKTAEGVLSFVTEKFTKDKQYLTVVFYGGEPLLSTELIKSFSHKFKSFCESRGASYAFNLITNGSLLTRQVAEALAPLGLKEAKITIDGPAETHNKARPFKSGAGSFDRIITNIKQTCDIVNILVTGNYDRNNYKRFPLLLDYMAKEGLTPDTIGTVRFDPVAGNSTDYSGGCMSVNEPWVVDADSMLKKAISEGGWNATTPASLLFCATERKDSYVINFNGVLYKCPTFIGKRGFEAGDIWSGVKAYATKYSLGIWKNEKCLDCEYLPLCFGGCRYMSYVKHGDTKHLDCKKAFFDASLERTIKSHYSAMIGGT